MGAKYQEVHLHLKIEEGSSLENKLAEPANRTVRRPFPIQHHSIFLIFFSPHGQNNNLNFFFFLIVWE